MTGESQGERSNTLRIVLVATVVVLFVNVCILLISKHNRAERGAHAPVTRTQKLDPKVEEAAKLKALAAERRAKALEAFSTNNWPVAVESLAAVIRDGGGSGDEPNLLKIAKEFQEREQRPPEHANPTPPFVDKANEKTAGDTKGPAKKGGEKHVAVVSPPTPAPAPVANGTILVASNPSSLAVMVDGEPKGTTLARISVPPGSHTVAVYQDDRKLDERTANVKENALLTFDFDVQDKLRTIVIVKAPQLQPPEPTPSVLIVKQEPPKPPVAPPPAPLPVPAAAPPPVPMEVGDLFVAPSTISGDVWINGRSYGPPPQLVKGIPAGKALVELRVDGATKRKLEVTVAVGKNSPVKFR